MINALFTPQKKTRLSLPYYAASIKAGFPSPADDYVERSLDLNEYLIKNPAATFFVKVKGDSMINAGIFSGDILIVDRSLSHYQNKIVVAVLGGEFTVKRFQRKDDRVFLMAENPDYPRVEVQEGMDFEIWGVVVKVIHNV